MLPPKLHICGCGLRKYLVLLPPLGLNLIIFSLTSDWGMLAIVTCEEGTPTNPICIVDRFESKELCTFEFARACKSDLAILRNIATRGLHLAGKGCSAHGTSV